MPEVFQSSRGLAALAAAVALSVGGCASRELTVTHKHEGADGRPIYPQQDEMGARLGYVQDARIGTLMAAAVVSDSLEGAPFDTRAADRAALLIFQGQALRILDLQMRLQAMNAENTVPDQATMGEVALVRRLSAHARDFAVNMARSLHPDRPIDTVMDDYRVRAENIQVELQTPPAAVPQAERLTEALVRLQLLGAAINDQGPQRDPAFAPWMGYSQQCAQLIYIDVQRARAEVPLAPMSVEADYRIGLGARALAALCQLQNGNPVEAVVEGIDSNGAQRLRGQSRRDAEAFATFREFFAGVMPEANQATWRTLPLETQIRTWFLYREIAEARHRGPQVELLPMTLTSEEGAVLNRMADQFELRLPPPGPAQSAPGQ